MDNKQTKTVTESKMLYRRNWVGKYGQDIPEIVGNYWSINQSYALNYHLPLAIALLDVMNILVL